MKNTVKGKRLLNALSGEEAMQRFGKVLRLRAGMEDEYKRQHEKIWPEVKATIERSGIKDFTIFRYGQWIFSYFWLPDEVTLEDVNAVIGASEVSQRWEEFMHTFQEPLPESQGLNWWVPMEELWHLDESTDG